MPKVKEIEAKIFEWAPRELAFPTDNIGHLIGDRGTDVHKILVALDITPNVIREAIALKAELIVSHHPIMNCHWNEVQNVRADTLQGGMIMELIRNGISAICMHTNLDCAKGGVNDCLAQKLGLHRISALSRDKIGRIGTLSSKIGLAEFLSNVVQLLEANGLRYRDAGLPVHKVAVGGGACGDYMDQAIAAGCDTFVTADLKYNHFLDHPQINIIDAGHFPTENVVCPAIVAYLQKKFPKVETVRSASHRDVIEYYISENH